MTLGTAQECTGPGTAFRIIEKEAQPSWDEVNNKLHMASLRSRMAHGKKDTGVTTGGYRK